MMHTIFTRFSYFVFFLFTAFTFTACSSQIGVRALLQPRSPYEAYAHGLRETGLHRSALGQSWIKAGQQALEDSLLVSLPFQETGYFRAEKPLAAAYSFQARHGELIEVSVSTRTRQDIQLFLDLYEAENQQPRKLEHVAAADTTSLKLAYRVTGNRQYLVRLQPELLKSGSYTITINTRPSLAFPVQGKDSRAVQSFWGAARDGGARRHEGVDIFAAQGTPVLASSHGVVSRVQQTRIGGKVIWLSDTEGRQSLYYAHLDRQLVTAGQRVAPGDTLGLVGTTGNARGTHPHLHFGIYTFGGAVDPFPFIAANTKKPAPLQVNTQWFGEWARASKNQVSIRRAPYHQASQVASVPRHTAVQVFGGTGEWFRVALPNGQQGYLHEDQLEKITKPVKTHTLAVEAELLDQPLQLAAPVARIKKDASIAVLGLYQMYQLVRLTDGTLGWLSRQI